MTFWREGSLASGGIKLMAERGSKSGLDAEVRQAISAGTAEFVLSGPNLSTSPGSTGLQFDITPNFPFVTLVTMVAQSPDWFVGVSSVELLQGSRWLEELRVDLYPHDAGTDSGVRYGSPDQATQPPQPISRLTGYPAARNGVVAPFGTFIFRKIE